MIAATLLSGCVPLAEHRKLQKKIGAIAEENNTARMNKTICEERVKRLELDNRHLIEKLSAPQPPLEAEKLEEIKKQAFEEVDRKFNIRVKSQQQKK